MIQRIGQLFVIAGDRWQESPYEIFELCALELLDLPFQ